MSLNAKVSFEAVLEVGNRLQIPKLIQQHFKIEQTQILKVRASPKRLWGAFECFYVKMDKQGRILVPKLTLSLMVNKENPNLEGYVFNVSLEPT
jgi:DNA-binding transcriptional regulator/RsmH inhibitor MraZ